MNGEGSEDPIWLFVGEAPGGTEDSKGYPFCGLAGSLLRDVIEEVGIPMDKCRFTNVVRCRPPKNDLKAWPDAYKHCRPHILREIRATKPKVIVLLGNTAIQSILGKRGIMKLHGAVIDIGLWKYVCCLHPSYVLRTPTPVVKAKFREAITVAKEAGMNRKLRRSERREHIQVVDKQTLYEVHDICMKQKYLGTDIEGSTLSAFSRVRKPILGMVGFAWDERTAANYFLKGNPGKYKIKVRREEFLESMKEIWENKNIRHIAHFGKYDYTYAAVLHDIWMGGKDEFGYYADTGQMSYVLDERPNAGHSLKDWAYKLKMGNYEQPKKQWEMTHPDCNAENGGNILNIPLELLGPYNMDDCIACYRLFFLGRHLLKKERLWERPFKFPQMWHNWTAAMMEITGLRIDADRNAELQTDFLNRIEKREKKIYEFEEIRKLQRMKDREVMQKLFERVTSYKKPVPDVKEKVIELFQNIPKEKIKVNLNSPPNKRTLIYEIMGYTPVNFTPKSKEPATDKDTLEEIKRQKKSVLLNEMVKFASLSTGFSKYIKPVPSWIGTDGRTHTNYKPHGQLTGRVSSEDPNHENLPKHGELASELLSQFTSTNDEYVIMEQDSKQIEMRLFADRAQDDMMIKEFADGKDPHAMGAMAGFEISEEKWLALPDDERKELRFLAKSAVSFGILYGRQAPALAADFGKSIKWAQQFIDRYFAKYDDCLEYRLARERYIMKHKIVFSNFFRPRRLPLVDSDIEAVVAEAIRQGINAPIQGDGSDITWVALHRIIGWLRKYKMKSKGIIAVHDASYIDTYYKEIDDVMEMQYKCMTDRRFIEKWTGWYCSVPWDTDCKLGRNMRDMVELKHGTSPGEFIIPSNFR